MNRSSSFVLYLFLISTIITIDQASKRWVLANLSINQEIKVTDWYNVSLNTNRGISWSMFSFQSNFWFLILTLIISTLALSFAFYAIIQHLNKTPIYFESFVIGGAISNIIDRITHHFVIDFIDIHIGNWHFPTFNVADVFVVAGIFGILIKTMWKKYD